MIWRLSRGLLTVACVAMIAGCENSSQVIKPDGAVAVPLNAAKKRGSVAVGLANLLSLTLPPAAPGLGWQISFHDPRYLKQQTDIIAPKTPEEGPTVSFVAVTMGSTRLRFVLVPLSPGRSVTPVDQQELFVTIR